MRLLKFIYLAAGLGLFAYVVMQLDMAEVAAGVLAVGWIGFAAVLALHGAAFAGDSIAWLLTVTKFPVTAQWSWRFFVVRLAGEAFNYVVPAAGMGGEPVKATLLNKHFGVDYPTGIASLVLTRTLNMLALIGFLLIGFVFMILGVPLPGEIQMLAGIGLAVLTLGTVLLVLVPGFRVTSSIGVWMGRENLSVRFTRAIETVREMESRIAGFFVHFRARFWWALALGFVNWVMGIGEVYVVMLLVGAPVSFMDAWIIEAVAQMVRTATFFIPASLGAQEGAFVVITGAITGSPTAGLSMALIRRMREVIWIGCGFAAAGLYALRPENGRDIVAGD